MHVTIHNSSLVYKDSIYLVNDYHQYIVSLLKQILESNSDLHVNIIFDDDHYNFNTENKIIRIKYNFEHTLVRQGGRHTGGAPIGIIHDDTNDTPYLVRIGNYEYLNYSDIIIDYSIPNIHNVKESKLFSSFSKKHIYIAASLYEPYSIKGLRSITTLTTFINTNEPRRQELLYTIKNKGIEHKNVNNCFDKKALETLYKDTKILINIHQTPDHHTFEELRVLPALQCGVLVVCEKSPLSELIPYNDYIIWADYGSILDKVQEVISSYDMYFNMIFATPETKKIQLSELTAMNYKTLQESVIKVATS